MIPIIWGSNSAAYVLQLALERPAIWSRIALIAPTWRGPLPTAMGEHRRLYAVLRRLGELPLLGQALYRLNVTSPMLTRMYRKYMYGNPDGVTRRLITEKGRGARQRNARYAAAAFVTGALDPVRSRKDFLELIDQVLVPLLAVCGSETPVRFWEEMATLFQRPDVTVSRVPGALAPHEENPAPVSRAVEDFLRHG